MNRLYSARRLRNQIAMALSLAATLFGLGWLVLILGALLWQGFSGLSFAVFTEMTPPPGSAGGLLNPIAGSLLMTVFGTLVGTRRTSRLVISASLSSWTMRSAAWIISMTRAQWLARV